MPVQSMPERGVGGRHSVPGSLGTAPHNRAAIIPKRHSGMLLAGIQGTWLIAGRHRHDETRWASNYVERYLLTKERGNLRYARAQRSVSLRDGPRGRGPARYGEDAGLTAQRALTRREAEGECFAASCCGRSLGSSSVHGSLDRHCLTASNSGRRS